MDNHQNNNIQMDSDTGEQIQPPSIKKSKLNEDLIENTDEPTVINSI